MLLLRATLILPLLLPLSGAAQQPPAPRSLAVAAAANLKPALDALGRAFEEERPGARVIPTYGASGTFFAQILSGAPFDVFFSADRDYPRKIVEAGLGAEETVYAVGILALWVRKGSRVPVGEEGLPALADPSVRRIAIANPAVAPYGRAAEAALARAGVLGAVQHRLVLGQSVSQAAQFATSGAADAALLPLSLAMLPALSAAGRFSPLPPGSYPPIEQAAVVLSGARDPELARAFLSFVRGSHGRTVLAAHGYGLP